MPWVDHQLNVYKSLVDPPPGYSLQETDVLTDSVEGPDDDESDRGELDLGLKGLIIFRAIISCPEGVRFTCGPIDSKAVLCTKGFWRYFWKQAQQKG